MAADPYFGAAAAYQLWSAGENAKFIRAQADIKKDVDGMNADFAELDAFNAETEGFSRAARYESDIEKVLAEQAVQFAAKDVDVSFGTAAEIQAETRAIGQLNLLDIKSQAHSAALGYKRQARSIRLGSGLSNLQSQVAAGAEQSAGALRAINTGLSGYQYSTGSVKGKT